MRRTRALTSTAVAGLGLGLALTLSACGSNGDGTATAAPHRHRTVTTGTGADLLPAPTGPAAVGVRTVPGVSPAATTRVWFPARPGTGSGPAPYADPATAAAFGPDGNLAAISPAVRVDAVPAATTHARPAVVVMPGWGNPMAVSTTVAQDLASHGYVVVAVDPDPGSEDGTRMPADPVHPARRLEQVAAAIDFAAGPRVRAVAGPVDADRIAVGGHSIAGAVAFQVALDDPRVSAVFDLDGWLHGPALTTPVRVPALVVNASGLEPGTLAVLDRTPAAVTVKLTGATHGDVTDLPCIAPAMGPAGKALGLGPIGCTGTTTSATVVRRFLDAVLRDGRPTPPASSLGAALGGVAAD